MDNYGQLWNAIAVTQVLAVDLPTRATEWSGGAPHLAMRDGVIKLSKSKERKVYWAYYDYTIASPYNTHMSASRKMQEAHNRGKIAVAYLECHCHECRFISRDFCSESPELILAAYEEHYPVEAEARYGYVVEEGDEERDYADEARFYRESPCLIMQAIRARDIATRRA